MNIDDVLRELGKELGLSQKVIDGASAFAKASTQGEEERRIANMELSEEQVRAFRLYGLMILKSCRDDPGFKKKFIEMTNERINRN